MNRAARRLLAIAGAVALVGAGGVTACAGDGGQMPTTSTTGTSEPTSKVVKPGPGSFSPAPLDPLSPTVGPTQNAEVTHS